MQKAIEESKTYPISTRCINCGKKDSHHIPKGEEVWIYLSIHRCFYCGCIGTTKKE